MLPTGAPTHTTNAIAPQHSTTLGVKPAVKPRAAAVTTLMAPITTTLDAVKAVSLSRFSGQSTFHT